MANARWRAIHEFAAFSGDGKVQSAFNVVMDAADIDTRDACRLEINENVTREQEFDCDDVDLVNEPIQRRFAQFRLNYEKINAQILARFFAYKEAVAAAPSGSTVNEVQSLTRSGSVTGGTFTIELVHEGKTGLTEPIAWDASTATILAALNKKTGSATAMGKVLKAGDVTVGGTWGTAITLTFTGRFAATNVALVSIDNALITGGGTIVPTQTTAGSQITHALSRSSDATLLPFSFATGDKNESVATRIYQDCAVDSIDVTVPDDGGNITAVIVINAYYVANLTEAFSVPACVNITPLKAVDCKVNINSVWQTGDIASLSAAFNSNIATDAAFGYDDIDMSSAFQRGDRPTQNFDNALYGTSDTAIYTTLDAEETAGNEVAYVLYLGQPGSRLTITASTAKLKFKSNRWSFAGPLRQSVINFDATPHSAPPLTFSASISQATQFLQT